MDFATINQPPDVRKSPEYESASGFLFGRLDFERSLRMPYSAKDMSLGRMRRLLEQLGNPHDQLKVIHVAGTKGKGSTSAFLTSALAARGLRCGTYTSPHLHFVEERFSINGESCGPSRLVQLIERVRPAVAEIDKNKDGRGPTFFEITTAIAFLYFLEEQVDIAVFEVGLGGRLDSTNVCRPLLSIITSISFDHTKQLGNTLTSIASEKAGIIKPDVHVVSGVTNDDARLTIARIAEEKEAPLTQVHVDFRYVNFRSSDFTTAESHESVDFEVRRNGAWQRKMTSVSLGLRGEHQAANAALAWAALNTLPQHLQPAELAIRAGFRRTQCPARIEVVSRRPLTIVDAAHNVASVQALMSVISNAFGRKRRTLILGITKGKDAAGMLRTLLPAFDQVVCSRYLKNPRGCDELRVVEMATRIAAEVSAPCVGRIAHAATPRDAWAMALSQTTPNGLICITGSFFIAAELRELLVG